MRPFAGRFPFGPVSVTPVFVTYVDLHDVKLKPQNLGYRGSGEEIDFTIVFVVEEESGL